MIYINYGAVIATTIISFVLGFLWYGPIFGKQWTALMGITPEKMAEARTKGMTLNYVLTIIGSFIMSVVLAKGIIAAAAYLGGASVYVGIWTSFCVWLGFIAPVTLGSVLWDGRSWKLWSINNGYYLANLLIMGIILSIWI